MPPSGTLPARRVFATRGFDRWRRTCSLGDRSLIRAVDEMHAGLVDADLGRGLLKKRAAAAGRGKRGGFRLLVATNKGDRWFFLFGYSKNERDEIDLAERAAMQRWASDLLALDADELTQAVAAGELRELDHGRHLEA